MFHRFFNSLARSRYLSSFSHSFSFILWSTGTAKSIFCKFSFFCWLLFGLVFWSILGDLFVCQSPIGIYVCRFLGQMLGRAFVRMVEFKFLAHFRVDHLDYPVVSYLILLLNYFASFAYYVIDSFISITPWPPFAILLRLKGIGLGNINKRPLSFIRNHSVLLQKII